jgi:hypothetical protein
VDRARALIREREPIYARARLHLDAERVTPTELVRAITEHVEAKR